MVVVIRIDAYPFLAFSDLTCHLEDTGIVFSSCTMPDSKKPNLKVATKRLFHQKLKILG